MLELIKKYSTELIVITSVIAVITPYLLYILKERKSEKGDADAEVSPTFWSLKEPKIRAVHLFEASDSISGYTHLSQNSRPDQWKALIEISNTLGFRTVKRKDDSQLMQVVISRDGREKYKVISFME